MPEQCGGVRRTQVFVTEGGRQLERIIRDYDIRGFNFTDDNLFINLNHAYKLMEQVVRKDFRIKIGKPFRMIQDEPARTSRPSREELDTMTTEIMVRIARLLPETHRGYYRELMGSAPVYTEEL